MPRKHSITYTLAVLFILYLNIILSFAIIYLILDFSRLGPVVDHYHGFIKDGQWFDPLLKPLYFSAVTLLSVGYGDVTPFGWSRVVAVIEAMTGYILPATLAVQYIHLFGALLNPKVHQKKKQ